MIFSQEIDWCTSLALGFMCLNVKSTTYKASWYQNNLRGNDNFFIGKGISAIHELIVYFISVKKKYDFAIWLLTKFHIWNTELNKLKDLLPKFSIPLFCFIDSYVSELQNCNDFNYHVYFEYRNIIILSS